jgi:REP element-mobilizing transposase RayT
MKLTKTLYFTTSTVVDWIDVFTRPIYKRIVVESLSYCQQYKGLTIHAWVLMTNHLHMVVSVDEHTTISEVLRDFKKYTSKKIEEAIRLNLQESRKNWMLDRFHFIGRLERGDECFRFWQEGNYVEEIYSDDFLRQKIEYIHNNPVKAEIVSRPEYYMYSSASTYAGVPGVLPVALIR